MKQTYKDFCALFVQEFPEVRAHQDVHSGCLEIEVHGFIVMVSDPENYIALAGEGADGWVVGAHDSFGNPLLTGLYKQVVTTDILEAVDVAGEMYANLLLGVVSLVRV